MIVRAVSWDDMNRTELYFACWLGGNRTAYTTVQYSNEHM